MSKWNKVIYIPDVHFKNDATDRNEAICYNNGLTKVFNWLFDKFEDYTLIINGDLFDVSNPSNNVREHVTELLKRFKKVIVNTGNHDYKDSSVGNALSSLGLHDNIVIISEQGVVDIDGIKIHFFPHKTHFSQMKEYEKITESDCHYSMLHCMPYEEVFGDKELKEKASITLNFEPVVCHIYSHIHKANEYYNIKDHKILIGGIVQATREGEQEWPNFVYELSETDYEKIEVPKFMTIKTIDFKESVDDLNKDFLYNIINCPSKDSVYDKFENFYVRKRGIHVLREKAQYSVEKDIEFNIEHFEKDFAKWATENNKPREYVECLYEFATKN